MGPVCLATDGGRPGNSPDVQFWAARDDLAADSAAGDSPNCRDSRDDWPRLRAADDTRNAAHDMGCPNRSSSRDCNKLASLPNSIPNRPIPTNGCRPSASQSRSQRRSRSPASQPRRQEQGEHRRSWDRIAARRRLSDSRAGSHRSSAPAIAALPLFAAQSCAVHPSRMPEPAGVESTQ